MRIKLSEFDLPGLPGIEGEVVYKAIDYDGNSATSQDGLTSPTYFVCGWREDDGAGVLLHGTPRSSQIGSNWRVARLISAPSDPESGITVSRTEFHGVEALVGPYVRLVGCVETKERPGSKIGFLYEGMHDGSGEWYPVSIDGSSDTVVKGTKEGILVCSDCGGSDAVHIFSLEKQEWTELHCGYADEWTVDEIILAGDIYVIRLLHSDGKRSDLSYSTKK